MGSTNRIESIEVREPKRTEAQVLAVWLRDLHNQYAEDVLRIDSLREYRYRVARIGKSEMFLCVSKSPSTKDLPLGFIHVLVHQDKMRVEMIGEIMDLYVDPRYRGSNVAPALINRAEQWFREKAIERVELYVHDSNERAIRFYQKHGYMAQHQVMRKTLLAEPDEAE